MADIAVKICGLTRPEDVTACAQAGANYVGLVFFPKSPRNVALERARDLAVLVPPGIAKVALVVNASDDQLNALLDMVPIDMLQLHGAETPQRVAEVRAKYGLPVMKAVGIAERADLPKLDAYQQVADQILVDAKAPKDGPLPGGNGVAFDWTLVANRRWTRPWMLAGGLTPGNVGAAIELTGAKQVDVSSGVEAEPGLKSATIIADFVTSARRLSVPTLKPFKV